MAHYVDLTNKEWSHGDPWDWSHYPGDFLFSLLAPTFSRLRHHRIPDLSLCDHKTLAADWKLTTPSENFPLAGYKKNPVRKGGNWFFSKVSHPLVFPLINFLFLPDNLAHSLFLHTCLIFWCQNPGGKIHHNWAGSSHKPTFSGLLPCTLPRNWDELQDGTLHLPCWTDIHTPAHISSIGYKGEWNWSSQILSLFSSPSARWEDPMALRPLALCPSLTLK